MFLLPFQVEKNIFVNYLRRLRHIMRPWAPYQVGVLITKEKVRVKQLERWQWTVLIYYLFLSLSLSLTLVYLSKDIYAFKFSDIFRERKREREKLIWTKDYHFFLLFFLSQMFTHSRHIILVHWWICHFSLFSRQTCKFEYIFIVRTLFVVKQILPFSLL